MLRPTLFATAALLLALAGCNNVEPLDSADALRPIVDAMETPPLGHELYRMYEAQKRDAVFAELPSQF